MATKPRKSSYLNLDMSIMTSKDYHQFTRGLGKIQIKLLEKIGQCPHRETHTYAIPSQKPEKVRDAPAYFLEQYNWRVALGVLSWNNSDREVYRVHCPDHRGTVWETRRID